ncbi:MAG TPA: AAA family ATPase [Pyrinomonadaceae bacterium]|jgi:general secretion pathway protein A|nr:AAA family ATPase [Pyrinomonadaceae bacterium]
MKITDPFSISPNPNSLFITPNLKAVLYQARGTINRRQGLVALLADAGMGKSTVMRFLYGEFDAREDVTATFIPTPQFPSLFAMVKSVCADFGIEPRRSLLEQQDKLQEFLAGEYSAGRNVVLFIDEAQLLSNQLLEGLRAMLNFETNAAKLIQVVMSGQLELKIRIDAEKNKAIKSRIHSYALLNPLTDIEMRHMIDHRCKVAEIINPFTPEALERIYEISKGVPRHILKICDKAYDYMHLNESDRVTLEYIDPAAEDAALEIAA